MKLELEFGFTQTNLVWFELRVRNEMGHFSGHLMKILPCWFKHTTLSEP